MAGRVIWLIVIGLLFSGCASVESRWKAAQKQDSVAAYEAFIQKFPKSEYVASAHKRVEEIEFERASNVGTEMALEAYLKAYPKGSCSRMAMTLMEQLAFKAARTAGSETTWESFLSRFPKSESSPEAITELRRLRYENAKRTGTTPAYEEFLDRYREGPDAQEVKTLLEQVLFKNAVFTDSEKAYNDFLTQFPNSDWVAQVESKLRSLRYEAAKQTRTVAAYEQFFSRYPEGADSEELRNDLPTIRIEERDWSQVMLANSASAYLDYYRSHRTTTRVEAVKGTLQSELKRHSLQVSLRERPDLSFELPIKTAVGLGLVSLSQPTQAKKGEMVVLDIGGGQIAFDPFDADGGVKEVGYVSGYGQVTLYVDPETRAVSENIACLGSGRNVLFLLRRHPNGQSVTSSSLLAVELGVER